MPAKQKPFGPLRAVVELPLAGSASAKNKFDVKTQSHLLHAERQFRKWNPIGAKRQRSGWIPCVLPMHTRKPCDAAANDEEGRRERGEASKALGRPGMRYVYMYGNESDVKIVPRRWLCAQTFNKNANAARESRPPRAVPQECQSIISHSTLRDFAVASFVLAL